MCEIYNQLYNCLVRLDVCIILAIYNQKYKSTDIRAAISHYYNAPAFTFVFLS